MKLLRFFLLMGFLNPTAFALSKDEEVQFFPSYAHWDESRGGWGARLRGWVFEPEEDSLVRKGFIQSLMRFAPPDADQKLFHDRVQAFLVDSEESKTVRVSWGTGPLRKIRSGEEGELKWNDFTWQTPGVKEGATIPVRLTDRDRSFEGRVHLIGPEGLTVITDIDDTIKISSVTSRNELLANTFFRPWRAVPGMAHLYQEWAKAGAVFHYVSNSPWPLEAELETFLKREGFPAGTMHLRPFSASGSLAESLFNPEGHHKEDVLRAFVEDFPQRQFILVGDSGERDPEIYGGFARMYPDHVGRIFIRRVSADRTDRYERAFAGLVQNKVALFDTPSEITGKTP